MGEGDITGEALCRDLAVTLVGGKLNRSDAGMGKMCLGNAAPCG